MATPPGIIKPTNSATSVRQAATDVLGVTAGTIFSQISLFVVPESVEKKNRITPAVVVAVACTVTLNNNYKMLECYVYDDDEVNTIGDEVLYLKKIDDNTVANAIL